MEEQNPIPEQKNRLPKWLTTVTTFSKLLTTALFIILPFVGFYLGLQYQNTTETKPQNTNMIGKNNNNNVTAKLVFSSENPNTIIQSVYGYLKNNQFNIIQPEQGGLWWLSDDKWNILDLSALETSVYFKQSSNNHCFGPGPDESTAIQKESCSRVPQIMELNKSLTDIFLANGFTKNELNSSKSLDDPSLYDYQIAFQRNETRCLLVTNAEGGYNEHIDESMLTLSCSNNFQKAYQEQLPYLQALVAYNPIYKNAVVGEPINKNGDFVTVGVHFRRSGSAAVMKKVGESYKVLYTAQQFEKGQCAILIENDAPQSMLKGCN